MKYEALHSAMPASSRPGDGAERAVGSGSVGGYPVAIRAIQIGKRTIELAVVADLESLVDREAILRGDGPEPPYWAYLWTGAVELARQLEEGDVCAGREVLDLGCGLGLVGVVAGLAGGRVTFLDRETDALRFAAMNARRNDAVPCAIVYGDFTRDRLERRFDLILGAEVLYEAVAFGPLVDFIDAHLAPGGAAWFADAHRTDTRGFHGALAAAGYEVDVEELDRREEGLPLRIDILRVRRRAERG